jgi:hypothetical protein
VVSEVLEPGYTIVVLVKYVVGVYVDVLCTVTMVVEAAAELATSAIDLVNKLRAKSRVAPYRFMIIPLQPFFLGISLDLFIFAAPTY